MQVWLLMSITLILSVGGEACKVNEDLLARLATICFNRKAVDYPKVLRKYCNIVCDQNTFPQIVGPECRDVSAVSEDNCHLVVYQWRVASDKDIYSTAQEACIQSCKHHF